MDGAGLVPMGPQEVPGGQLCARGANLMQQSLGQLPLVQRGRRVQLAHFEPQQLAAGAQQHSWSRERWRAGGVGHQYPPVESLWMEP